ncbi:MAG: hypothetical protein LAT51_11120 [Flavobacteriaceae bacterium]|nr:hypothetical protein [Flavobacteriaceae bacterium]
MKTNFFLILVTILIFISCESDDYSPVWHQNDGVYVLTKYESETPVHLFNDFEAHTDFSEAWIEPSHWTPDREAFRFFDRSDGTNIMGISYMVPAYKFSPWPFGVSIVSAQIHLDKEFSQNVTYIDISQSYNYTDLSDIDFLLYEEKNPALLEFEIIDDDIIHALFLMRVFDVKLNEYVYVEIEAEFLKVRGRNKD